MYYITGECQKLVYMWTQGRYRAYGRSLNNIIEAYERDFAKHPNIIGFLKSL